MLSKEEYIELYVKGGQAINAILEVLNNLAEVKVEIAGEEAIKIIRDFQRKYFDLINEHFEVLDVIREESDDIQTVIDLLDVLAMGHIDVAIKKLEIIQDKLMGVK